MLDIMTLQQAMAEMRAAGGYHMSRQTMILAIAQHPDMFPFVQVVDNGRRKRYIIFRPDFEKWMRQHGAYN